MKVSTLIALLKTYPQNADVTLLGLSQFYIYYYKDFSKNINAILLDTELLDDSDIETSDNISLVKVLDTKLVHSSFEKSVADAADLDDQVKIAKSLLKILDGKDGK